jgi:hypothetical protein
MSPLCIRMLLHYSWSPRDYHAEEDSAHARSPAVAEAMMAFLSAGLVTSRFTDLSWAVNQAPFIEEYQGSKVEKPIFTITDKGRAMVEHLCAVEVPICKWIQP